MSALATLLSPRLIGLKNMLTRGERRGLYLGLGVFGVSFWIGLFALLVFLVGKFWGIEGLGPFLARRLMEMLLVSLFVMLTFSNVITALSTFFLAEDLELVLALPVQRSTFHYSRFLDTLGQASWMMVLFGVPVFLAYGYVTHAPLIYYASMAVAIPCYLAISSSIGILLATVLVNVFPARRTRELMVLLALLMIMGLFIAIRSLRPERLVNAQEFDNLAQYLAEISVPAPVLFPPRWASTVLSATLLNNPFPWLEMGLLVFGAIGSAAIARWVGVWGYETGWTRAQEARSARFYRSPWFDALVRPLPVAWRGIVAKDLRVFVRDPAQWSQAFLLSGLCAIYLVSINALPISTFQGPALRYIQQGIAFLNIGMGGFVMAAIAARFQFTAVSREGRAWWVLRSAPVDPTTFLYAKSVLGLGPMLIVGEIVVLGSGYLLQADPRLLALEAVTMVLLAVGISGISVAFGAIWPDFKAETMAKASASPAAMFFMVIALILIALVMTLEGAGLWAGWRWGFVSVQSLSAFAAAAALCVAAGVLPLRKASEILWNRGL